MKKKKGVFLTRKGHLYTQDISISDDGMYNYEGKPEKALEREKYNSREKKKNIKNTINYRFRFKLASLIISETLLIQDWVAVQLPESMESRMAGKNPSS